MFWRRRQKKSELNLDDLFDSSQGEWKVFPCRTDEDNVEEFYTLFLTLVAINDCSQVIFRYEGKSFGVYAVKRSEPTNRTLISKKNIPKALPPLLERALDRTYSCKVSQLQEGVQETMFHIVNDPVTKLPSRVFDSYLSRKTLPNGYEYIIDLEWRDSSSKR